MKVHILFTFKEGAAGGGGNQFLKTLKSYLSIKSCYSESIENADIILFNSYQYIPDVAFAKRKYPKKIFIHRIDGPIRLYNTFTDKRDFVTNTANWLIADGTIFQSQWSREENKRLGFKNSPFEIIIMNAPDTRYFNRIEKKEFSINRKINLIATSWSSNTNKGFEIYKWIDKNLDFTRYKMTFIGNSSVNFTKVEVIPPLPGSQLALRLKESDIFITASKKDPCSNSLIEALHCGLPSIALKDGGHPDIINKGGECFQSPEEIPSLLEKVVKNYKYYQSCIDLPSLETIGDQYCNFFSSIIDSMQNKKYTPKNFSAFKQIRINTTIGLWTLSNRFPIVNYLIKH